MWGLLSEAHRVAQTLRRVRRNPSASLLPRHTCTTAPLRWLSSCAELYTPFAPSRAPHDPCAPSPPPFDDSLCDADAIWTRVLREREGWRHGAMDYTGMAAVRVRPRWWGVLTDPHATTASLTRAVSALRTELQWMREAYATTPTAVWPRAARVWGSEMASRCGVTATSCAAAGDAFHGDTMREDTNREDTNRDAALHAANAASDDTRPRRSTDALCTRSGDARPLCCRDAVSPDAHTMASDVSPDAHTMASGVSPDAHTASPPLSQHVEQGREAHAPTAADRRTTVVCVEDVCYVRYLLAVALRRTGSVEQAEEQLMTLLLCEDVTNRDALETLVEWYAGEDRLRCVRTLVVRLMQESRRCAATRRNGGRRPGATRGLALSAVNTRTYLYYVLPSRHACVGLALGEMTGVLLPRSPREDVGRNGESRDWRTRHRRAPTWCNDGAVGDGSRANPHGQDARRSEMARNENSDHTCDNNLSHERGSDGIMNDDHGHHSHGDAYDNPNSSNREHSEYDTVESDGEDREGAVSPCAQVVLSIVVDVMLESIAQVHQGEGAAVRFAVAAHDTLHVSLGAVWCAWCVEHMLARMVDRFDGVSIAVYKALLHVRAVQKQSADARELVLLQRLARALWVCGRVKESDHVLRRGRERRTQIHAPDIR